MLHFFAILTPKVICGYSIDITVNNCLKALGDCYNGHVKLSIGKILQNHRAVSKYISYHYNCIEISFDRLHGNIYIAEICC